MRISWLELPERIKYELLQREEEGNDCAELRNEWMLIEHLALDEPGFRARAAEFYRKLDDCPKGALDELREPSSWEAIALQCPASQKVLAIPSASTIEDRILGGWLGRSAGCLLGKPIEKTTRPGIRELLSSNNTWPYRRYQ